MTYFSGSFHSYLCAIISLYLSFSLLCASPLKYDIDEGETVRSSGMGNAFSAISHSHGALQFNPAGLAVQGGQYSYQLLDAKSQQYSSYFLHSIYAHPFGYSFGKRVIDHANAISINTIGYAHRGSHFIDWGISVKKINIMDSHESRSGIASDMGIMMHLMPFLDLGIVGKNFFTKDMDIQPTWLTGVSVFTPKRKLILASDIQVRQNPSSREPEFMFRHGMEVKVTNGLISRLGWNGEFLTAGAGITLPFLDIDYAVELYAKDLGSRRHLISFQVGKGTKFDQFRKKYTLLKPKSYAILELGKSTVEGKTEVSLLGGEKLGSNELIRLIRFAREDPDCKGFLIRINQFDGQLSRIGVVDEIRYELLKAKRYGKKIIVFIDHWATLSEYYLATVADQIYMPELGTISHLGIEIEVQKIDQLLSKFGISADHIESGKYKARLNNETKRLTQSETIQLESFVTDIYTHILGGIQEARNLSTDTISSVFTGQFITASHAKSLGLIDEFSYWETLPEIEALGDYIDDKTAGLSIKSYQLQSSTPSLLSFFNQIAVIEIDGPIIEGRTTSHILYGGKTTGSDDILNIVSQINKSNQIRGVVVRVNSPGGSLFATAKIYDAISTLRKNNKLVYVSMGNMAASGGYFIGLNADKIFANPISIVGSIGVISSYRNYERLFSTLGINHDVVRTGDYMSVGKSRQALSFDEKKMLAIHQDHYYQYFVDKLMFHRQLSHEEAYDVAQGQPFLGKHGKKLKLIDEIGSFEDTIDALSGTLKISNPNIVRYKIEPQWNMPRNIFSQLFEPLGSLFNKVLTKTQLNQKMLF
jgi:protease-4